MSLTSTVRELTIGTRRSQLALWQTEYIARQWRARFPEIATRTHSVITRGDREADLPLPKIGGKGLFTEELDRLLLAGEIDCAVHSLKDLPTDLAEGIALGAILSREDPRDVWICPGGYGWEELPCGARVGTSSLRRQAQILVRRPDLKIEPIRGNVPTRIEQALRGDFDAIVIAGAGVSRLGLQAHITAWLPADVMLPAPGQGALAVTCRAEDQETRERLRALHDAPVADCTLAEREFLAALGGGCAAPIAALATPLTAQPAAIRLTGRVASVDGQEMITATATGVDPYSLARGLAEEVLQRGAKRLLNHWRAAHAPPAVAGGQRLAGWRVAVTRAADECRPLCELLSREGAQAISIPALQFRLLGTAEEIQKSLNPLAPQDWVIVTSAHAIRFLIQLEPRATIWLDNVRIACVGPATAEAVRETSLQVSFIPSRFTGACLAEELPLLGTPRVLWLRPRVADEHFAQRMAERGVGVEAIPIYETVAPPFDDTHEEALAAGIDAVLFASASAAEHFLTELAERPHRLARRPIYACIGPTTAEAVRAFGIEPEVVSPRHTFEGLVEALADYAERRMQEGTS